MKKIIKRYRDLPLVAQLSLVFVICIVISIGVNQYFGITNSLQMYIDELEADSRNLAHYAAEEMYETGNLDWLIPYWNTNYASMEYVYDDEAALEAKRKLFLTQNPTLDLDNLSAEELEALSPENQKLYAEIEFMDLVDLFDDLKRKYHPTYLFCCSITEDNRLFYYVTGTEEGEVRGGTQDSIFVLGSSHPFDAETYPVAQRTFLTGIEQLELEQPVKRGEGSGYYQVYVPLRSSEGYTLGLVGVTLESYTAKGRILTAMRPSQISSGLLFFLSALALAFLVRSLLIRPVGQLQKYVKQYSEDKDSEKVVSTMKKLISKNEVGSLAEEFSKMVVEIDRYTKEVSHLASERERINAELDLATTIQASYLPCIFPAFPERPEFDVYATMDPAKEVGGDFYDFFLVDEDHLGLVIADVSGKGVPAALFMMISKTLIKNHAQFSKSPAEVMTAVNNQLCENNEAEMFVTVWLGILEISTGKMVCANAGHEYPAIKKKGGAFELLMDKHGMVLGGMEGLKYREYELQFESGDELFVYTDGVPEATSKELQLFETDRMLEALNGAGDASPEELTTVVRKAIDDFVEEEPQFDDITMLVFSYKGPVD